jgi:nitroreductase
MAELGIYEAMRTLRAVRRLRSDPIPDDVLTRVLEAATFAPSGGNLQPWRIVVVRDPARRRRLQELYEPLWQAYARGHRAQLEGVAPERLAKQERMLAAADHLARHLHEAPVLLVFCFDPALMAITDLKLGRPSVVGGGSVYPAVQNALLAARAEGLGCTLTTLLCQREAEVKALLGIPDGWGTCAVVPVGWPAGRGHGPISRRPPAKMAFADQWGVPWGGAGGTASA